VSFLLEYEQCSYALYRYRKKAEAAHEKTRKRIEKQNGNCETFNLGDAVYAFVHLDKSKRRGTLSKKKQIAGNIVQVYATSGTNSHTKYNVKSVDGVEYTAIAINDVRKRLVK
jgi:hypothetical protein